MDRSGAGARGGRGTEERIYERADRAIFEDTGKGGPGATNVRVVRDARSTFEPVRATRSRGVSTFTRDID